MITKFAEKMFFSSQGKLILKYNFKSKRNSNEYDL